jgi:hypothetical protein
LCQPLEPVWGTGHGSQIIKMSAGNENTAFAVGPS